VRRAAPAMLALGGLAALALVGRPLGAGATLIAWAVLAVAALAAGRRDAWTVAGWLGAAALATVPTLRAAGWIVWPSLLAAGALGALAAAGGASWRAVGAGLVRAGRLGGGVTLVGREVAQVLPSAGSLQVVRGGALGAGLLALFVPLFASADAAFAQLLDDALPTGALDRPLARGLTWVLVAGAGGALLRAGTAAPVGAGAPPVPRLARTEWTIALGLLAGLFAAFVALQLATLYGGDQHVLRTAGLTYAEYARQGFAQLIAAAALTLAVIAGALRWAVRDGARDERRLRALLGALCVLTLVVLASALTRLGLYEAAYGFTRLRLVAHMTILWLGTVFVLVIAAGLIPRGGWLPRAVVATSVLTMLGFALANPDGRIATRNGERYVRTGDIDTSVLRSLSADATPAIVALPPEIAGCLGDALERSDGPTGANLARSRARAALSSRSGWPSDCSPH
jgi:Domain of unknown function (DUF4173)